MNIILSTRNPSKAEQIKALFNNPNITIQTLADVGIEGEATEDSLTLYGNALKKALFAKEFSNPKDWVMAEDTGIFIDALNGDPGVYSARWAGEGASTEDVLKYCLKKMEGISNRAATFETTVVVIDPKGATFVFIGSVRGHLLTAPKVSPQPKMPYSGIFMPEGINLVWAEMSVEQENAISHRGKAFGKAKTFLENILKQE
ncbi:MAG: non-canonical purine NTP pyrophosphatase [Candidatus Paceibacterota bacterium]|jgi:XTP/dITP diphosphohydrolase